MGKIGFTQKKTEDQVIAEDTIVSDSTESYTHTINFLGIPVIKITKNHRIDTKQVGK